MDYVSTSVPNWVRLNRPDVAGEQRQSPSLEGENIARFIPLAVDRSTKLDGLLAQLRARIGSGGFEQARYDALAAKLSAGGDAGLLRMSQLFATGTLPANGFLPYLRTVLVAPTPGPTPGQPVTVPGLGIELMPIPAGSFLMGSPPGELGRDDDETQHRVTISRDFWLGTYEVTQAQWQAVMGTTLRQQPDLTDGDVFGESARIPMYFVSWDDANDFCRKLNARPQDSRQQGYVYRLPTEAEWEYACRAGTSSALYSGKELTSQLHACPNLDALAWYDVNAEFAQAVGGKPANALGLHDMLGNVWEWCRDWHGDYPTGSVTDPVGASSGVHRVTRGGSLLYYAKDCRAANRSRGEPVLRNFAVGFRLALAPARDLAAAERPAPKYPASDGPLFD